MAIPLKQSTASQEIILGPLVDDADGDTAITGLTIANTDIKLWKQGATTLANKNSGSATEISNGFYYAVLDATDTDTLGALVVFVHRAEALPIKVECVVLPANVYDSSFGDGSSATDMLDVSVAQWAGTAVATPSVAGVPEVDLTHVAGATTNVAALATNVDAILTDTAVIGAAGAGLTAVPWNASWDAEVQSEVADALEVALADSIPADGSLPSVKQALYMLTQFMLERNVAGTTVTVRKADGTTSLFTLTLNDATTPTNITRAT